MPVSLRKDTNTLYVDFWYELNGRKKRYREKAPIQKRRAAERYEREVRERIEREGSAFLSGERFDGFASQWFDTYTVRNTKSEKESKEAILRLHLRPFFGEMKLINVDEEAIASFVASQVEKNASPKSINNRLAVLRKMLATAHEWKRIPRVPKVDWMEVPEADVDFLTFDEAKLLMALPESQWRTMMVLVTKAGLRLGELLALRWRDVDFSRGIIRVAKNYVRGETKAPKGKRIENVEMSNVAIRELQAQRARTQLRGELVFCHPKTGGQLTKNMVKRPLWRACRDAGLRRIGWHVLRHTFVSHLVMKGVNLRSVQKLARHRSIKQTMGYAHLAPGVNRDAVNLLDDLDSIWTRPEKAVATGED